MKKLFFLLMAGVLLSCLGESSPTLTSLPTQGSQGGGGAVATTAAATITLEINPNRLVSGASSTIKATVLTSLGTAVPDGTSVSFTVNDTSLGTITSLATTSGGTSTALFTAGSIAVGSTTIAATSGSATQSASIVVVRPETGSIEFVSASPKVIGIKGSGQTETSRITFRVKDVDGNPVKDGTPVDFTMSELKGGEYIGAITGSTTAQSATQNGLATVTLNSGLVAGPVNIIASVTVEKLLADGKTVVKQTFASSAPSVSIGGGVPSAPHFTLATDKHNLPGLIFVNKSANISTFMADRFGNFNVLEGTTISFFTEAGAIGDRASTNAQGAAQVTLRTQSRLPVDVPPLDDRKPVDGLVTVLAVTVGEEAFKDFNGNGKFDIGEPVTQVPEPFLDEDDNGQYDPGEFFIDADKNNAYSPANTAWDGPGCDQIKHPSQAGCLPSKMIWRTITLVFTGQPICTLTPSNGFTINAAANAATVAFNATVGDINNNMPPSGTTIKIDADAGQKAGPTDFTLTDNLGGLFQTSLFITDDDATTTKPFPGTPITVTLEATPGDGVPGCKATSSGFLR